MSTSTKKSLSSALLPKHKNWLEHFWFGVGILLFKINGFPEKNWRTPPTTTEENNEDSNS